MQKTLALTIVSVLVLAGCTGLTEDTIDELVETVVPGCNDPGALNYDASATNADACMSEAILATSITDFLDTWDNPPAAGETMGISMEMATEMEGMPMELSLTQAVSQDGLHFSQSLNVVISPFSDYVEEMTGAEASATELAMYCESDGATYDAAADSCGFGMAASAWTTSLDTGGSTIYVDYGDDKFYMNSAMSPAETLAAMIAEDEDDMDDDDMEDDEWGMVDPSQFDWSTANFTSTIELEGTEVMFVFSTELTVEDVVQTITIHVDQNLEVRVFDLVSDEGDMTITSFTDAQIAELMDIDTSMFTEQEALPFTVGWGESFDMMVHEESNDDMTMIWDCEYFTNESTPIENGSWDSLDDSMCGDVVDSTIVIDETYAGELGMPQAFYMADDEEEMLISISNAMIISFTMSDYSVVTGDSTGMWCEEEGGTYDASADTCSMTIGEITAYDDMYMEVYNEEDGFELVHYQYDASSQSGFIASTMYGYTCHDGEVIDADWVNDGWDDCADGSDEFDDGGGEEWTFICGNGDEIPFSWVNDGMDDCEDGSDEQQYDVDGNEINWYDCMDGSEVWIHQVNDGVEDCPDGDDEYYEDDHGYDYFDYIWNCQEFIEESAWTEDGMDAWDGSSFDLSLCETMVDWDLEMSATESTMPMSWYMFWDDEDEILIHMELIEDIDNEEIILHGTVGDFSVYSDEEYCEGEYDSTMDTCTFSVGEYLGSDDSMIAFYDYEEAETMYIMYVYDETSGNGAFAFPYEVFMCYSGDEWVEVDWYDDGVEDCADGSDEPEYEGDGIETTLWFDGADLLWQVEYDDYDEYWYVEIEVYNEEGDLFYEAESVFDNWMMEGEYIGLVDGDCYYATATSYDEYDMYLTMSEEWWCVGDDEWEEGETYDFMVHAENSDMMVYAGDLNDYNAVLAMCDYEYVEATDEYEYLCNDSSVSVSLVDAMAEGGSMGVFFFDSDDSGTLTEGDYFTVSDDVEVEWDTVRLYSNSAQAYSDENPLSESVPGFTALLTVIGLLGAVLIRKNE